jgi:hypothetical protein
MKTQLAINATRPLPTGAAKEMLDFERREIEFRKKERKERAAELRLPIERQEFH